MGIIRIKMLRQLSVVLCFAVVGVWCDGDGESEMMMPREQGVCLEPDMMAAVCTINTDIGAKMEAAHAKCAAAANAEMATMRRRKNKKGGKKNKNKCVIDFGIIQGFFNKVWGMKACVFKEVGWVSAEGDINRDAIMESLNTLPNELATGLSDTESLCMNRSMDATLENIFASDEFGAKAEMTDGAKNPDNCKLKVTDEQLLDIEITLQKLAFFRCVHENFMEGCGNFILNKIGSMVEEMKQNPEGPSVMPLQG